MIESDFPFKTSGFGYTIVQEVAGHTHIIVYTYIESKAELIEKIKHFFLHNPEKFESRNYRQSSYLPTLTHGTYIRW